MSWKVAWGPLGKLEVGPVLSGCGWEAAGKQAPWKVQALTGSGFALSAVSAATSVMDL